MAFNVNFFDRGNYQNASLGGFGLRVLTGSSAAGEYFYAITAMEDSVISCTVDPTTAAEIGQSSSSPEVETALTTYGGDTSITSLTLLAGVTIYGNFHTITMASGKIVAYLG